MIQRACTLALILLGLCSSLAHARQNTITGVVLDASGAPIADATVAVQTGSLQGLSTKSGPDGRFSLTVVGSRSVKLQVAAVGFASATIDGVVPGEPLRVVLGPAPLAESVTVTASRGAVALETPAAATVMTNAELVNSAAGALDDALRNTPGFTLFRRSSSRVANPTTQGVTLRGVSGSGASRTLVLADGLPLNDPFGSWVYWNRIPQAAIDRIEIVRGASGDLYGADALGGVIQVLTLPASTLRMRAIADAGSASTTRASVFAGGGRRGWSGAVSGEALKTDGEFVIADRDRGTIDRRADSDYRTGFISVGYDRDVWRALVRASVYGEDRGNGTAAQINKTDWRQVSGQARGPAFGGLWVAHAAGGTQNYYQTFTAVATDRKSERLTTEQRTPSSFSTYSAQWTRSWGSTVVLAGGEGRRIKTDGSEIRYSLTNVPSGPFPFGGTETDGSAFGRISVRPPKSNLLIAAGVRFDGWKSVPVDPTSPDHSVSFISPRVSASWTHGAFAAQGSAYRAHRTPTLNELYRGFRVGNVNTNPNALLEPEQLTGVEGGVLVTQGRMSARATVFYNNLADAIANISLNTTTRQRQNADTIHVGGLELEADCRPSPTVTLNALAVVTSSHFRNDVKQPQLEGKRVPQVAPYQFGGGIIFSPHLLTATIQARIVGAQYEDDVNTLKLNPYGLVDVSASRTFPRGLTAFFAVENLFDQDYQTGKTPVTGALPLATIGWPRTARVGVRVFLP